MEQLVTFETALAAKKIGYAGKGERRMAYTQDAKKFGLNPTQNNTTISGFEAPTQAVLQRWLREEKKISVEVNAVDDWNSWVARVYGEDCMSPFFLITVTDGAETYEGAMEEGLRFAAIFLFADERIQN